MKRFSGTSWQITAVFTLLILVTIISAVVSYREDQVPPPLSSSSSAPNGAKALRVWLEELGYSTSHQVLEPFSLPVDAKIALILEPQVNFTDQEWEEIDHWVEAGGSLILAGRSFGGILAIRHYDFQVYFREADLENGPKTHLQNPLPRSPAITAPVQVDASAYLVSERHDYVTHLAYNNRPILISFDKGDGRVIISTESDFFSNQGLKDSGNPYLALNFVASAAPSGMVWFDEWHHGLRPANREILGPGQWLRYTPAGHALLYTVALILLALILSGRRFGRPVPLLSRISRRAPREYVDAVANLNRRAGNRSAVLGQFHQQIKRQFSRRYRINPTLPDDQYTAELARFRPDLDDKALLLLLTRLNTTQISEREMVQLARQAAIWLEDN